MTHKSTKSGCVTKKLKVGNDEYVLMLPDTIIGVILGFFLTLATSIVSIFFSNRYAEKQWIKRRSIEEQENVVEEVYSPLYFILMDLPYQLGIIAGRLKAYLKRDLTNKAVQVAVLEWLKEYEKEEKPSHLIKTILQTKLGMIYPIEFRRDLFFLLR